ncbi:non-histone protein [Coemansia sp. RSA 988]|nr:non-histone protein [Coemansia sp. RSA 988]
MVDESAIEKHHKYRCRELRRQLEELEGYNDILAVKLQKSQKRLRRMKVERNILLERFEHTRQYKHDDDSSDSDAPLRNTFPRATAADNDADQPYAAGAPVGSGNHRGRRKAGAAGGHTNSHSSNGSTPRQTSVQNTAGNGENPVTPVGVSTRKPRAEKDPNAPKRPANAFVLYCQVERPNIKSAGTELSSSELTRAMGVKWRNLSEDKKQKYFDMYEREMARYNREMATYKCASAPNGSTTPVTAAAAGPADLADDGSVANVVSSPAAPSMDVDDEEDDDEKSQPPTANGDAAEGGDAKAEHQLSTASEVLTPSTMTERDDGDQKPDPTILQHAAAAAAATTVTPPPTSGAAEVAGQS